MRMAMSILLVLLGVSGSHQSLFAQRGTDSRPGPVTIYYGVSDSHSRSDRLAGASGW